MDVRVTAPWLQAGYRLYRAIADRSFDVVVFDGNACDAYPAGRARETLSALETTRLVIRLGTPAARTLATEPYVAHHALGAAVTERLAVELADAVACEPATHAWMRYQGWKVAGEVVEAHEGDRGLVEALARARRPVPPSPPVDDPLVSVVVPLHERTSFLPHCLDTLARQDYARLEVVVADDGSASPEVVSFLADVERRSWPWPLRVERLLHGGLAAARNGGWRAAAGDSFSSSTTTTPHSTTSCRGRSGRGPPPKPTSWSRRRGHLRATVHRTPGTAIASRSPSAILAR